MPKLSTNKIKKITNLVYEKLENDKELSGWESTFIEDIVTKLSRHPELTSKQYDKLLDIIGTEWL